MVARISLEAGDLVETGKLKRRLADADLGRLRLNRWEETDTDQIGPKEPQDKVGQSNSKSRHEISKQRELEKQKKTVGM